MSTEARSTDERSHTPGPWHLLPKNPLCIESRHGNIGLVNLARASEADARLIAAAPEMLAALRAVVSVADRKTDEFDLAHAAIAKATGEHS